MTDFLRECNTGDLKIDHKTFTETWCARCHRQECDLAALAKTDPMAERNATWRERFFGTPLADLAVPKFAQIARLDFPNLLQKAMRLEIADRRQDWTVPEIPVLDGRVESATPGLTNHVDAAVRSLAGRGAILDEPEPDLQADGDEPEDEDEPVLDIPPPVRATPPSRPDGRNTPDPGEVMLGGSPAPAAQQRGRPTPETDPWAAPPKPAVTVIKTGAKIQFGTDGKAKVTDG